MAPGHEQDLKMGNVDFGTAGKLKKVAEIVLEKMGGALDANKEHVMQELRKKKEKARKIVKSVPVTDVEAFKKQMAFKRNLFASVQKELKEAYMALQAAAPVETLPDASGEVGALYKTALQLDSEFVYTTCVYVVFCHDDKIKAGKLIKGDKTRLQSTFGMLDEASKGMPEGTRIFEEEINALRASVK